MGGYLPPGMAGRLELTPGQKGNPPVSTTHSPAMPRGWPHAGAGTDCTGCSPAPSSATRKPDHQRDERSREEP